MRIANLHELTDRALARRCADLSEDAWRELLRRHEARIARAISRALGHRATAEDVKDLRQEVYARLLANGRSALSRLLAERPGALASFLSRTASRVAREHLWSKAGQGLRAAVQGDEALGSLASASDLEAEVDDRRRRALFDRALQGAVRRPGQLALLRAHFVEGLAPAEIARLHAGLTENGVEALIRRARARLVAGLAGAAAADEPPAARRPGVA